MLAHGGIICGEELKALWMLIPGALFLVAWMKMKWHHFKHHRNCKNNGKPNK